MGIGFASPSWRMHLNVRIAALIWGATSVWRFKCYASHMHVGCACDIAAARDPQLVWLTQSA